MFTSQIEKHTQRVNQVKSTTGQLRLAMKQGMTISTAILALYCTTSTTFVKDAKLAQSILAQNNSYTSSRCFLTVFTQNRSYHDKSRRVQTISRHCSEANTNQGQRKRVCTATSVAENYSYIFYILTQNPQCSSRGVQSDKTDKKKRCNKHRQLSRYNNPVSQPSRAGEIAPRCSIACSTAPPPTAEPEPHGLPTMATWQSSYRSWTVLWPHPLFTAFTVKKQRHQRHLQKLQTSPPHSTIDVVHNCRSTHVFGTTVSEHEHAHCTIANQTQQSQSQPWTTKLEFPRKKKRGGAAFHKRLTSTTGLHSPTSTSTRPAALKTDVPRREIVHPLAAHQ